ncbi:MAG: ribosome maturation factor RimM [Chloroflexi bacterium]|nr:ribosome maturation factor RimM [Chloroflexota bacterium]
MDKKLFPVGKITTIRSFKGEIKVWAYADHSPYFNIMRQIFINQQTYTITSSLPYKNAFFYLKLDGIDDETGARALVGGEVAIAEEERQELSTDEYLLKDLIGMNVHTKDGSYQGKLTEVLFCPANDVYVVVKDGKESLIPAVKDIVKKVDTKKRLMIIEPAIGMLN